MYGAHFNVQVIYLLKFAIEISLALYLSGKKWNKYSTLIYTGIKSHILYREELKIKGAGHRVERKKIRAELIYYLACYTWYVNYLLWAIKELLLSFSVVARWSKCHFSRIVLCRGKNNSIKLQLQRTDVRATEGVYVCVYSTGINLIRGVFLQCAERQYCVTYQRTHSLFIMVASLVLSDYIFWGAHAHR